MGQITLQLARIVNTLQRGDNKDNINNNNNSNKLQKSKAIPVQALRVPGFRGSQI
jgi:hypothetical protein